jgi:hypothetical protein
MRAEGLGAVMMSHASFNHNEQEHASACPDLTRTLPVTPNTAIMVHIMTANFVLKTKLIRVKVGDSGLKRIKANFFLNELHHIFNTCLFSPILQNMMSKHLVLICTFSLL